MSAMHRIRPWVASITFVWVFTGWSLGFGDTTVRAEADVGRAVCIFYTRTYTTEGREQLVETEGDRVVSEKLHNSLLWLLFIIFWFTSRRQGMDQ